MRKFFMRFLIPLIIIYGTGYARTKNVRFNVESLQFAQHQGTKLTITAENCTIENVALPNIPNVVFTSLGTSNQTQIINGSFSQSEIQTYRIQSTKLGDITIPQITVKADGKNWKSDPIKLKVLKSPPHAATGGVDLSKAAQISMTVPRKNLYLGEAVPIKIELACIHNRKVGIASLSIPPNIKESAVQLKLSAKPTESTRTQNNQQVYVVQWDGLLTPLRSGKYPIKLDSEIVVKVQKKSRRRSFFDDSFFGGNYNRYKVQLASEENEVIIKPLPANPPADFSGAIGNFHIKSHSDVNTIRVGDPLKVKLTISGSGSFNSIKPPTLNESSGWKMYDPEEKFKKHNSLGNEGEKTFNLIMEPLKTGDVQIPPFKLCYFNPIKGKYLTNETKPINIKVTGTIENKAITKAIPSRKEPKPEDQLPMLDSNDMAPLDVKFHNPQKSLSPLINEPWYQHSLGGLVLLIAFLLIQPFIFRNSEKTEAAKELRKLTKEVRQTLYETEKDIKSGNAKAFFENACRAVSLTAAHKWKIEADSITAADLRHRLKNPTTPLAEIFESADAVQYAGKTFTQDEMKTCFKTLKEELTNLEESK